jgi:hypothetical protein
MRHFETGLNHFHASQSGTCMHITDRQDSSSDGRFRRLSVGARDKPRCRGGGGTRSVIRNGNEDCIKQPPLILTWKPSLV